MSDASRGGAAALLVPGLTLLGLLLGANVAAYFTTPQRMRTEFQYEPSQVPWIQTHLSRTAVRDTITAPFDAFGFNGGAAPDAAPTPVFDSRPLVTARLGDPYTYVPASRLTLRDYSVAGAPPGVGVDPATGTLNGRPTAAGRYEVVLKASIVARGGRGIVLPGMVSAGRRAEQHFTMYVDDRWLPLGTDRRGRDVVGQLAGAARFTLVPGLVAVLVAVGGGMVLGALGGFYSGATRRILNGATSVIQSLPALLVVFLAAAVFEYNTYVTMAVVGLVLLPETANGVAECVTAFRTRDFVEAARELGLNDRMILWNEIVWHNARPFLVTMVTRAFVYAILVDVTLSYVSLTNDELPRLGLLLNDGRTAMIDQTTSVIALASLGAILLVIVGFSLTERGLLRMWERRA